MFSMRTAGTIPPGFPVVRPPSTLDTSRSMAIHNGHRGRRSSRATHKLVNVRAAIAAACPSGGSPQAVLWHESALLSSIGSPP